jgi:hypothetical protein
VVVDGRSPTDSGELPTGESPIPTLVDVLADPDRASLKQVARAYGCAPEGSAEEARLAEILQGQVRREAAAAQVREILQMTVQCDPNDYAAGFNHGLREACRVVDPDAETPPSMAEAWKTWPVR